MMPFRIGITMMLPIDAADDDAAHDQADLI